MLVSMTWACLRDVCPPLSVVDRPDPAAARLCGRQFGAVLSGIGPGRDAGCRLWPANGAVTTRVAALNNGWRAVSGVRT